MLLLGVVLVASAAIHNYLDPMGEKIVARLKTREELLAGWFRSSRFHKTQPPNQGSSQLACRLFNPGKGSDVASQPVGASSALGSTTGVHATSRIIFLEPQLSSP